ncbi:hypothetical protein BU23DRAFT_20674 [Bimuria novae-zelandiae CBS 107.79]|uniref:Uncharacterized protein n=1 Tax=Bimuria novae-zelandiae CBS 107.79 TaxID=1447943 RepID=A0A6A5UMH6_9PLEO|nr:hypothetical protein BU23DRAFT_20674 [Bimuria novae-zelandiae CBS 107.79]
MPLGSTEFSSTDLDGGYLIYAGELFCRAFLFNGDEELCGRKFTDRGALIHHLKVFHPQYRISPAKTGRSSILREHKAREFYRGVMLTHDHISAGEHIQNTLQADFPQHARDPALQPAEHGAEE